MLVLSRKCGERIVLPDQDIIITVLEVRGEQVRLGFTAPDTIPIYRQEIWTRIKGFEEQKSPEVPVATATH